MIIFQLIQKPQKRGAEIFAAQLSENLKKLGHQVVLITIFEGKCELPFSGEIINLNRPISKRLYDYKGWKQLANLIEKYKPDIIQCNAGDTLKFAVFSKVLFNWKSIVIARNASLVSRYVNSRFAKILNHFLYSKVDFILSVSENSKNDLIQLYPFTNTKIDVIPVGIEIQEIHNIDFNKYHNSKHIVHVGGFTFEKNHIGLLNIWEIFSKKKENVFLHLIGDGPLQKSIVEEVENRKIKNVVFYGWVNNPLDFISKADMLILPSKIEGLPAVILEAMYVKTPIIANNVGGISEVLRHNSTGFLIHDFDEKEFANLMSEIMDENLEQIKESAYNLVINNYLNTKIALKFQKSYLNRIENL
jgi:glycosyltransferase involved in cell wall biosynthesis